MAETLLEATAQDNAYTGAEITRLREDTRAVKRKLAQARRERALKAMGVRAAGSGQQQASSPSVVLAGAGDTQVEFWGVDGWGCYGLTGSVVHMRIGMSLGLLWCCWRRIGRYPNGAGAVAKSNL